MKKLIVLATLAALPAVAMADVTISGSLAAGFVNTKTGTAGSVNTTDRTAGEIKFSGNEDLGNGLKAIWQVASRLDATGEEAGNDTTGTKKQGWGNRDTFLGVQGEFGKVRVGRFLNGVNTGATNIFENKGANDASNSYDWGDRYANTISYAAPALGGLDLQVFHSLGATGADETAKKYITSVSAAYDFGVAKVSYDTESAKSFNATGAKVTGKKHEFNVTASVASVDLAVGYGRTKAADNARTSGFGASASFAVASATTLKAAFWKEQDSKNAAGVKQDDDFTGYSLGVNYDLSKRTRSGVEFHKTNKKGSANDVRAATVYFGHKF